MTLYHDVILNSKVTRVPFHFILYSFETPLCWKDFSFIRFANSTMNECIQWTFLHLLNKSFMRKWFIELSKSSNLGFVFVRLPLHVNEDFIFSVKEHVGCSLFMIKNLNLWRCRRAICPKKRMKQHNNNIHWLMRDASNWHTTDCQ